jgi:hypothetical protein
MLTIGALACTVSGGGAPTSAPNSLATSAAATLTALAAPAVSATPAPALTGTTAAGPTSTTTQAPAASDTPAAAATVATTSATTAAPATEATTTVAAGCKLAYADDSTLYCMPDSGTPQTLATGSGLFGPALSPDGALIAYQVVITEGVTQLWVAPVAEGGEAPHVLVGQDQLPSAGGSSAQINSPNHYAWLAGTHSLIFDTRYIPTGGAGGPGEYINADLWKVDAGTGAVAAVLPAGQAGFFSPSPNGHSIAIARGTGLDLVNADGSNHRPKVVAFPAIVTYSEYTFKPRPQWSAGGSYFTVAIPSKDPMAVDSSVAFYRVGADGTVTPRGTHPGNYVFGSFAPPEIAPDGAHVVYAKLASSGPTPVALHMLTIQSDAIGDNTFDHQESAGGGWGWGPIRSTTSTMPCRRTAPPAVSTSWTPRQPRRRFWPITWPVRADRFGWMALTWFIWPSSTVGAGRFIVRRLAARHRPWPAG